MCHSARFQVTMTKHALLSDDDTARSFERCVSWVSCAESHQSRRRSLGVGRSRLPGTFGVRGMPAIFDHLAPPRSHPPPASSAASALAGGASSSAGAAAGVADADTEAALLISSATVEVAVPYPPGGASLEEAGRLRSSCWLIRFFREDYCLLPRPNGMTAFQLCVGCCYFFERRLVIAVSHIHTHTLQMSVKRYLGQKRKRSFRKR